MSWSKLISEFCSVERFSFPETYSVKSSFSTDMLDGAFDGALEADLNVPSLLAAGIKSSSFFS